MRTAAVAAVTALLVVGAGVFAAGVVVWYVRDQKADAAREAKVACGFMRVAASDDPDKTASFVRYVLNQGAKHAVKAERSHSDYEGFGAGYMGIAARAGGTLDPSDVEAVAKVCGPDPRG